MLDRVVAMGRTGDYHDIELYFMGDPARSDVGIGGIAQIAYFPGIHSIKRIEVGIGARLYFDEYDP